MKAKCIGFMTKTRKNKDDMSGICSINWAYSHILELFMTRWLSFVLHQKSTARWWS